MRPDHTRSQANSVTTERIGRPRRQDKQSCAARARRYAALLPLALLVIATVPRAAAATYIGPTSNRVVNTRSGAVWSNARRPDHGGAWTRGSARPVQNERVRHDESGRSKDLPLLAGRGPDYRNLGGTAVRSSARSLAPRTALLQRPLRDISARPLLQQVAACRRSATESHRLRAPPSFAR